jgi:translocation and assembly module TamA
MKSREARRAQLAQVRAAVGLALVLLLVTATGAAAAVRVTITGLEHRIEDNVESALTIADPPRGRLAESDVRRMHERAPDQIKLALEPFGYYEPVIRSELVGEGDSWRARYHIDPGPPTLLDTVDVRVTGPGAEDQSFRLWTRRFPLERGDVLEHLPYEIAKDQLLTIANDQGYLDAQLVQSQIRVDRQRHSAALVMHFETGPRYRFGPVVYQQDVVDPKLLEEAPTFRPGEVFEFDKVVALQTRLGSYPWFDRVEVEPRRDLAVDFAVPIHVTLTPSKPEKYTVGVGIGTDTGIHGRVGAELRRINRSGHRARVDGTISKIESGAAAQYQIPWPRPRSDVLSLTANYTERHTVTEDSRTTRGGAAVTRLRRNWEETYGIQYRYESFTVGLQSGISRLLTPEVTASRLKVDNRIDPRWGHRIRLSARGAEPSVLSNASFLQAQAEGKVVWPLGTRTRILTRADLGTTTTSDFDRLPPSFRFFAGGAQSVRGYAFRELGPTGLGGHVIGARHLVVGSVELEHRVIRDWGGAVFYDIGNAINSFSDGFEQGAGVGVRWKSPIGLLRVDAAWALTENGTPVRWHLRMGPDL